VGKGGKLKDYEGGANYLSLVEIVGGVYHLNYLTQHAVASTFIRFSEYIESPEFRGKPFTLEKYMDWYAAQEGEFNYFQKMEGFNIPSSCLKAFHEGKFDPLSQKEKEFLDIFKDKKDPFYIIGTWGKKPSKQLLEHEIAHGLYFTNKEYRKEANKITKMIPSKERKQIEKYFQRWYYHPAVWTDEFQANLLDTPELRTNGVNTRRLLPLSRKMKKLFKKHCLHV